MCNNAYTFWCMHLYISRCIDVAYMYAYTCGDEHICMYLQRYECIEYQKNNYKLGLRQILIGGKIEREGSWNSFLILHFFLRLDTYSVLWFGCGCTTHVVYFRQE